MAVILSFADQDLCCRPCRSFQARQYGDTNSAITTATSDGDIVAR